MPRSRTTSPNGRRARATRQSPTGMERVTISLDADLTRDFDALIRAKGYSSRSEAVRDVLRAHLLQRATHRDGAGRCIATLSYVYNHHERDLGERLKRLQHDHHDLTVSSMHAHLDHEECIETLILQGRVDAVRRFADALMAERGVRHGQLNLIPVQAGSPHSHGGRTHRHLKSRL
ncbi:MAG: nickel-responsive transcriptional regulator NikR [Steroidobacteraceae bacterium]